jgi:hypothetical protein
MLALEVDHIEMVLAAMIKAIFVIMGEPNVAVRQCSLAMDKWLELVIGFIRIVAIYIKYVQCSVNYSNKQILCFATVQGCAKAVNNLFKLLRFSPPADPSNPNNMKAILLKNMLREDDIARQRAPLDNQIFAKLR